MIFTEKSKAQSTLEYLLVVTAIVGVLLYAAATYMGNKDTGAVRKYLDNADRAIDKAADKLDKID
jgi:uncharacterized protein (UPF0333 family)